MHLLRPWSHSMLGFFGLALAAGALGVGCGPGAAAVPTTPTADPFAVVRATSEAAYQAGQTALERGDLMRGCPAIDTARTTDPDNRADIQQALARCLTQIPLLLATEALTPSPAAQRPIAAPTLAPLAITPVPPPAAASTPTPAAQTSTVTSPVAARNSTTLVVFRDPQGRFTLGAPASWTMVDQPQALFGFGSGAVGFRDPSGRAALDVAVDSSTRAVSPELYAAGMEVAMAQQVPGYANEQALPATVSASPSIRRVFTFTQHDANGRDLQARALQLSVVKGQTPYIITATAPADQFQQFSPVFDQMVESFRFS